MCQEGVKTRCLRALPNALSLLRLTGAATLAFLPVGAGFWAVYLLCGLSDMLDGALARRLKAESELGSKLDSLGDLAFVIVCAVRLLPGLELAGMGVGMDRNYRGCEAVVLCRCKRNTAHKAQ